MGLNDPLGHLVPPGALSPAEIQRGLVATLERARFSSGLGIPAVPTRYHVRMSPADRAWLAPDTEDRLARTLEIYADRAGYLLIGAVEIRFETDRDMQPGRPSFDAGYSEEELALVADPDTALAVFARG